jgi:hypothetical protein
MSKSEIWTLNYSVSGGLKINGSPTSKSIGFLLCYVLLATSRFGWTLLFVPLILLSLWAIVNLHFLFQSQSMISRLNHSSSQLILNVIHLLSLRHILVVSYSLLVKCYLEPSKFCPMFGSDDLPHLNCRIWPKNSRINRLRRCNKTDSTGIPHFLQKSWWSWPGLYCRKFS